MFKCGICGREFTDLEECFTHLEECAAGREFEEGIRVPCGDCRGTGEVTVPDSTWGPSHEEECRSCDGHGTWMAFCSRCWDYGITGMRGGRAVACTCDRGDAYRA